MKVYKANKHMREQYCKDLHTNLNMNMGPTRLENMALFILVDTDELQAQVNRMEDAMRRQERIQSRRAWTGRARTGGKRK